MKGPGRSGSLGAMLIDIFVRFVCSFAAMSLLELLATRPMHPRSSTTPELKPRITCSRTTRISPSRLWSRDYAI
jgi:hypothetical protein